MKIKIGSNLVIAQGTWPEVRDTTLSKSLALQYAYDTSNPSISPFYSVFSIDDPIVYQTSIYDGPIPRLANVNQANNDTYKTDFVTNWISSSAQTLNIRVTNPMSSGDPRVLHRFGNASTALQNIEALVSMRLYNPQNLEAQISVNSTSATDDDFAATGARQVRIVFLNSNYQVFTEDILLNGIVPVNSVNTNIRFIESFTVIKGTVAVGAIRINSAINGGGILIAQIGPATSDAFLCHHYVPTGSKAYVLGWGGTTDFNMSLKLTGQYRVSGNLTDQIFDLEKLYSQNAFDPLNPLNNTIEFYRNLRGVVSDEATYIRVTAIPLAPISTTLRAYLDVWQVKK